MLSDGNIPRCFIAFVNYISSGTCEVTYYGGNLKGRCNTESKITVLLVGNSGIYSLRNVILPYY